MTGRLGCIQAGAFAGLLQAPGDGISHIVRDGRFVGRPR